ncbi:class I SAM-dependent methyltransferase [Qipengyuania atrilutea]|uniref:Class I SAM-dependent methyltransferase n=1 Tax=Qipengyuania atrilutea TaxID=2744473 RepID=A0A850H5L1_9SPHN|nr:class I SAM-dependent methyltransferase [Actirhodobacter atriluteus]NVD45452.1 class I SAM-dependent methyltransferase [Actirhodobacter atriluteus]
MDKVRKEKVWKAFWDRQRTVRTPGVVSQQWDAISRAQFDAWADFSALLPLEARVLDLATGFGKLPEMLRAIRSDVTIVGIDVAEPLPKGSDGVQLLGGVSMEALPFDESQFDAVVSLFGFEYGDTAEVSREILRVLKPGGPIGFMVHRGDGPILSHNRKRAEQLSWAITERGLFGTVIAMLPSDNSLSEEAISFAAGMAEEGRRRYGQVSVAWELAESVRRTLLLGPSGPRRKLIDTLKFIEAQAQSELGRIASLEKASEVADDRQSLLAELTANDRQQQTTAQVALPGEPPFADLLIL